MPGKLRMTVICFHISAVLYVVLGILLLVIFASFPLSDLQIPNRFWLTYGIISCLLCIALAIGVEIVVWGLTKLKYWAWIVGIMICGLYVTSLFIILGGLGLWGLLDTGTQAAFQEARLRGR
jgi:hypothetical protein